MKTIKGPAIFLAQFADDVAPFNNLPNIAKWASDLGYKAVQIPTWDSRLFDLDKAAESQTYCDEIKGTLAEHGLEVSGYRPTYKVSRRSSPTYEESRRFCPVMNAKKKRMGH